MKTIRLDIEYPERAGLGDVTPAKASYNLIRLAVNNGSNGQPRQMSVDELREWSKVLDKLEGGGKDPVDGPIELEDSEFKFIYDKLKDARFDASLAHAIPALMDSLEAVKLEKK